MSKVRRLPWKSALDLLTTVMMLAVAGTILWQRLAPAAPAAPERSSPTLGIPIEPLAIGTAAVKGSPSAPNVMVVFSDFECPFCARFATEIQPRLEEEFLAKAQLAIAFKHFPLRIHQHAIATAIAAKCAQEKGVFWEFHDQVFATRGVTSDAHLSIAKSIGLDDDFADCLLDPGTESQVTADIAEGTALGIVSTPSVLFGRRLPGGKIRVSEAIVGVKSIAEFRERIESLVTN